MSGQSFNQLTNEITKYSAQLAKDQPDVMGAFHKLSQASTKDGVMDKKTKELLVLGIAIAIRCEGCIGFHVKKLVALGATKEEINEVCNLAIFMGGGPSLMFASEALKAFDEFTQ